MAVPSSDPSYATTIFCSRAHDSPAVAPEESMQRALESSVSGARNTLHKGRSASRSPGPAETRRNSIGFRVALVKG